MREDLRSIPEVLFVSFGVLPRRGMCLLDA
jgi:hypothetical protein